MPRQAENREARTLNVAVVPEDAGAWVKDAVREGGGTLTPVDDAQALVWSGHGPDGLRKWLDAGVQVTWVQLPSAGIESYVPLMDDHRTWTCAKGIYGTSVAEHALALALAGIHGLPHLARAHSWKRTLCRDLYGGAVTIIGGGGIAVRLIELLATFDVSITVVRRHPEEMNGVQTVAPPDRLHDALPEADAVFLAVALTAETRGMIGREEFRKMKSEAWLINVGRGALVRTDDLVVALEEHWIGGAALDVTAPEPLPADHRLWDLDNCLITPHCANPPVQERKRYAELVAENVSRRIKGDPLKGLVDPERGY
ncbi:MAG: NAD(P)-dependent oxidoreductase [Chloroflexota bacterium]